MSDGTPYNFIVKPYLSYDGSGVPVGGHAKVASQTEDVRGSCVFIYLIYTYITTYKTINTKLIGWGAQPIRAWYTICYIISESSRVQCTACVAHRTASNHAQVEEDTACVAHCTVAISQPAPVIHAMHAQPQPLNLELCDKLCDKSGGFSVCIHSRANHNCSLHSNGRYGRRVCTVD